MARSQADIPGKQRGERNCAAAAALDAPGRPRRRGSARSPRGRACCSRGLFDVTKFVKATPALAQHRAILACAGV